jgi:PAS domain S-box-containing protein
MQANNRHEDAVIPESGRFLLRLERGHKGVSHEIVAGSAGPLWTRILDAGWPLAEVKTSLAQHTSSIGQHWVFGGNSSEPTVGIASLGEPGGHYQPYEITLFEASDSMVWMTVKPHDLTIFDILESPLGSALSRVVRSSGSLFFIVSKNDWKPIFLGDVFERTIGLERAELAANPELWWAEVLEEDQSKVEELKSAMEWDGFWSGIIRRRDPNGVIRPLEWHVSKIPYIGNAPTLLLGLIGDATQITQLKDNTSLLHRDLAQSRNQRVEHLLLGIQNSKEGFALTDQQGCFTYMNAKHLEIFGFKDLPEVVGKPWTMLYDQEAIDNIQRVVYPVLQSRGYWTGSINARRRDGAVFSEELTLSMMPDGSIACNCRDRSGEIVLMNKLLHSQQLFRDLADHMPVAVVVRDMDNIYQYVNRAAQTMFPDILKDVIGRSAVEVTPHAVREQIIRADAIVIETKKAHNFEISRRLGGKEITLSVLMFPITSHMGEVVSLCSITIDITAARNYQLETGRALEQKRDLLAMQKEFISLVSHEFRTPLTAMQGAQYLLKQQCSAHGNAKIGRYMQIQGEAIDTLRELVDQVLQLNRIDITGSEVVLVPVRPVGLVQRVIDLMNDASDSPRIICRVDLPMEYEVSLNAELYRSALENLISNGLKYSPAGSIVSVGLSRNATQFLTTVSDHGRGIPAAEQCNLFQTFFRASNVGPISGTGLGLAIVKRAVDAHGGTVTYKSRLNEGSTFQISMPALPAPTVDFHE